MSLGVVVARLPCPSPICPAPRCRVLTAFTPWPQMTPEQITDFVLSYLMARGKPTEDGSLGTTLIVECQEAERPSNFRLLWSSEHARPDDVIDINRIRIWSHDHLLFDAEFLDSEFGSNRYRISAFERGTWLDVVASALVLQLREEGDAIRH